MNAPAVIAPRLADLRAKVACFSALPELSNLMLNHNALTDIGDPREAPLASTAPPLGPGQAGTGNPAARTPVAEAPPTVTSATSGTSVTRADGSEPTPGPTPAGGIAPPGRDGSPVPFAKLEAISLTGNRIADWSAVDRLSALPALRSLRFSGNPVTSGLGASEVSGTTPRLG